MKNRQNFRRKLFVLYKLKKKIFGNFYFLFFEEGLIVWVKNKTILT